MKALVLGARGFVGTSIAEELRRRDWEVVGSSRRDAELPAGVRSVRLDLTNGAAALAAIDELDVDVIVHLGAEPDVKKAELPESRATAAAMLTTTERLAEQCGRKGRLLALLSSDYVFDGHSGPYREDAVTNPLGEYGRSKLAAEAAVVSSPQWLVVRTSMVYGWPRAGHHPNFVSGLVASARRGEKTSAYRDVIRTPIYVRHLAGMVADLLAGGATGLYHAGSRNAVSMLDLSEQVCDRFGLPRSLVVGAEAGDADPSRPLRGGLEVTKATTRLSRPPATTEEGLSLMKEEEPAHV